MGKGSQHRAAEERPTGPWEIQHWTGVLVEPGEAGNGASGQMVPRAGSGAQNCLKGYGEPLTVLKLEKNWFESPPRKPSPGRRIWLMGNSPWQSPDQRRGGGQGSGSG